MSSDLYDKTSLGQREHGMDLLRRITLLKGSKVLDLGCGTGYLTKKLAECVGPNGEVIGIDPNVERLQYAESNYSSSNIHYKEGSASNIPGGGYDIVFANYVMNYIENKEELFKNVSMCLKKGGKFCFVGVSDYDYDSMFLPNEAFSQEFMAMLHHGGGYSFPLKDYRRIIEENEFVIEYMKEDVHEWAFKDAEELVKEYFVVHSCGAFDETHFDVKALEAYYKGRKVSFFVPYVTSILVK